jgi:RNA polymerase sigma-70 factor, ECF subfamily
MENDQDLWNRLGQGDVVAFEGFYRDHVRRLESFLRVCLGSASAAEDVAQEAFIQVWRHPNGFNPARSTLRAYLFGIARKRAADWWRHHVPTGVTSSAERPLDAGESQALIRDAMARLQPGLRSLLWLREVEGYSYDELAEILEIPLGTVKSRLFAAREELRRIWRGNSGNGEG